MALDIRLVERYHLLENGLVPPRGIGVLVVADEYADIGWTAEPLGQVDVRALGPVDPVGRIVGPGALSGIDRLSTEAAFDALESLVRIRLGVVLDDRPSPVHDDVVFLAPVVFVKAQLGFVPVDPVLAHRVPHCPPPGSRDVRTRVPGLEEFVLVVVDHRGRRPRRAVRGIPLVRVAYRKHGVEGMFFGLAHSLRHVINVLDPIHEQETVRAARVRVHRVRDAVRMWIRAHCCFLSD